MSSEEKKNLRYTAAALGLTAVIGGTIVKYKQEISDTGERLIFPKKHLMLPYHDLRPMTNSQFSNLFDSQHTISDQGYDLNGEKRCMASPRDDIGIGFKDNQTQEIYILSEELSCAKFPIVKAEVKGYSASIIKTDHHLRFNLLKINHCHDCLPHFEGKIVSSLSVGDDIQCIYSPNSIIAAQITGRKFLSWKNFYSLTNLPVKGECMVIENGAPKYIGWNSNYDNYHGILPNLESLRSFIKGTPLEDE